MNKSITTNGLYKLSLNLFRFTLPALIIPYVYRTLSPDNIGSVNYAEGIYAYINSIAILGLYDYSIRELGKIRYDKNKASEFFSNIVTINIVSVSFALAIYLYVIFFTLSDHKIQVISCILIAKLILLMVNIDWVNEAYEEYKFISIKTMLCRTVSLVLMFLLINSKNDYIIYVWLNVLFDFLNAIFSLYYVIFHKKKVVFSLSYVKLDKVLYHFKRVISTLFIIDIGFFFFSFDKVILGAYSSSEQVAYYSLVEKIVMIIVVLSSTLTQVTLPRLSVLASTDRIEFINLIKKIYNALMMMVIPMLIGSIFLSKEIMYIFGASEYVAAVPVLNVFIFYIFIFGTLKVFGSQILFALNKERVFIVLLVFFSLLNMAIKFFIKDNLSAYNVILITVSLLSVLSCILYFYIIFVEKININIFNKNILIYILGSLPMLALNYIHTYISNVYVFTLAAVFYSSLCYVFILAILKDDISQGLINKLASRFR
ncbi:oligosaccharide flippase family protein [Photobacterium carnosum]|uniref:oligosaccharide flippase family protein n=1 Tax=Photobacterium carnosum TaxID=2023717 RepID=UPI001E5730DD|nr:oligosaccharide flippase family protein [Photobacterium carnosum]MCD9526043.1 oligosaccharide flippase family protein [Photobacterium carnosum]